ncbi:hypothetical protein RirG_021260 [Rhizophagus irregularis DAOM 197198w]|uniref:Uncharacterized protein n=1 Tax=Rhizophagus irregularis (strain DAOM 197198w) TaxID=1432141 RepID=A0A015LQ04_RHIIW|nr:hypothetical protein RirG_212840 [Rhizophagus irregularis DAOM 197198w]EXX77721.1 hypothetical protein RirG_021260 [Rhizophagus irregularis DAOM 197198w]
MSNDYLAKHFSDTPRDLNQGKWEYVERLASDKRNFKYKTAQTKIRLTKTWNQFS